MDFCFAGQCDYVDFGSIDNGGADTYMLDPNDPMFWASIFEAERQFDKQQTKPIIHKQQQHEQRTTKKSNPGLRTRTRRRGDERDR
jgi:hypothetical protein